MKKESVLSSMVKEIGCALKRKTRALKARLIVYSLLAQTNNFFFLPSSSIPSPNSTTTTTTLNHHHCCQLQALMDHQVEEEEDQLVETDHHHCCQLQAMDQEEDHHQVEEEDQLVETDEAEKSRSYTGRSVIEMVKHSKEEAGEEFSLEKDIDYVADLFITNFHRQMRMQKIKHNSDLKRSYAQTAQDMLF